MIATNDIASFEVSAQLRQLVHPKQAYSYRIVPFNQFENTLSLYTDTDTPQTLQQELNIILGGTIVLEKVSSGQLDKLLSVNYGKSFDQKETLQLSKDFLEQILQTAKAIGSSDIHFEPFEEKCRIRFRLDGKLKEQYDIPKSSYPTIINKIKNRASLDISQNRLPQDGRITVSTGQDEFDIRVSTLPSLNGESIVLRILSKDTSEIQLTNLGFSDRDLRSFRESVKTPNGIILISGPTGSGKTTTLYATLKELNSPARKILTIEDPIEYTLGGVMQVQLREDIGLDFETALKTFLRQDPDIIMVGEIRDVKTANMAIRAALTGHLVLSTIHTNSAWATVSRLIDMGVPAHLIASTLNVSVAQRLVRKLCPKCKTKHPISKDLFPIHFSPPQGINHHYVAVGCEACYYTGYQGRVAIYELLPVTKILAQHIKQNKLSIDQYLEEQQIKTLSDQAFHLILEGITSVDEAFSLLSTH